jgi:caffeoyl-CoA O-methyltransferase
MKSLQGPFDLVFIDADKENYPHYFDRAVEILSPRGLIVLDNALRDGDVLKSQPDAGTLAIRKLCERVVKDSRFYCSLLPIRDGMMCIQRL